MEAPANDTRSTPPPAPGKPAKAQVKRKAASPPPADTPPESPPADSDDIGLFEVLRETFPGLATLLAVALAVLVGAIALAVGQPYQHREAAAAWTEADFWLERQPAGDGEPGLFARADFHLRPAADAAPAASDTVAVALMAASAGSPALLARPDGSLLLQPGSTVLQTGLGSAIRALAYAASIDTIVTLGDNGSIYSLWAGEIDPSQRQQTGKTLVMPDSVESKADRYFDDFRTAAAMSAAPDANTVVTVADDGIIESIGIGARGLALLARRETGFDLDSVAIDARATRGVAGTADGRLLLFTPQSDAKQALLSLEAHLAPVSAVAIADDGATIASGDVTGRVRIADGDGDPLAEFDIGETGVAGLALAADGQRLLTAGGDGRLRLWRRDGVEIGAGQAVAARIDAIAATPALDFVAVAGRGGAAHRFDLVELNTRPSWFALFAFALAGGLCYAFIAAFVRAERWLRRQREAEAPAPLGRVRAFLTSDGPVDDPRYAGKALNELATRLFRFLANRDTAAPVTVALTAEWGMGKSSAMRLLQRQLEAQAMPTIWFNAWHHQKEEQLFASLMEQIRRHATPSIARLEFFHPRNLRVRLRLLRTRLIEKPLRVLLFLGLLAFLLTILAGGSGSLFDSWAETLTALGAAGAAFLAFQNLVKPFAQNPLDLVQSWGGWFAPTRFRNLLGVRDQFAEAFDEVSRALGPERRLTIFIDDLDRCRKEQVVDVLEAVNFLVSTTECYVVLGISERPVKNAVGLMFKELAAAHALDLRDDGASDGADDAADERVRALREQQEFADSYLEKLINISIAIPLFDGDALRHWLEVSDAAPDDEPAERPARAWLRAMAWTLRALVVGAVLAIAVIAGSQFGPDPTRGADPQGTIPAIAGETARQATDASAAGTVPATGGDNGETATPLADSATDEPAAGGDIDPGGEAAPTSTAGWLDWRKAPLALLALLALAALAFAPRRSRRWLAAVTGVPQPIADLDAFKQAMDIYLPLVLDARRSPRAIKRFVNRMRFLTAGLDEGNADTVAGLIAIATAHEIGLVESRESSPSRARVALQQRVGAGIAVAEGNTWTAETWETYWDLFASASFGDGDETPAEGETEAPAGAAP